MIATEKDNQDQKAALPGSDIALTEQPVQSPLSVILFDDVTIGSLFKDALTSASIAEKETIQMIQDIRAMLNEDREDKTKVELYMLLAPIAKDFLTEYSSQTESKVKIAQAIATILKASPTSPSHVTQINVGNSQEPNRPKGVLESDEFKKIDILKPSFETKKEVEFFKDVTNDAGVEDSPVSIIHSPDYLENQNG